MVSAVSIEGLLGAVGLALCAWGIARGARVRREGRYGSLASVDLPAAPGPVYRSTRYRLAGRPDEVRRRADGTLIPVELKRRPAPPGGPPRSHLVQIAAYCLLLEESTGRRPPFGILRYGDDREFRADWDDATRAWVLALRRELAQPYDGRARPSPGRCRGCAWRRSCDRSAA